MRRCARMFGMGAALAPLLIPVPAGAVAAPGQAVENDWGQTATEVNAEIAAALAANPHLTAAVVRSHHYVHAPYVAVPARPVGAVASAGSGRVTLHWTGVAGARAYRVYRDRWPVGTTTLTSFVDTGLTNGTAYGYRVRAVNVAGWSPLSAEVTATPAPPPPPPPAPTAVVVAPGDTQAIVTWRAVDGATAYRVYRDGVSVYLGPSVGYTDTGLTNGVSHTWTVAACRLDSAPSAVSPGVSAVPVAVAAGAPAKFLARAGDTTSFLSWTAVPNATAYHLYRDGVLHSTIAGTVTGDSGLTNGTTYAYRVAAVVGGVEAAATPTVLVTPVVLVLGAPSDVLATAGDTKVTLSWSAVANATSYRVLRDGVPVGAPSAPTFTDSGLTDGTTYAYTVQSVGGSAVSPDSSPVAATPAPVATSGTFSGAAVAIQNGHGTLRVTITVAGGAITSSVGMLLTNDGGTTLAINQGAIPQYDTRAVAAQSAAVATVTGATLTGAAYRTSLQTALTQAGR